MSMDPRKRQKKLERRTAKRKEKKLLVRRQESTGLAERMAAAADCPVLHCWVSDSLDEQGMGPVVLSRVLPDGQVAFACFLIDRYCLGVKNVFADVRSRPAYLSDFVRKMRSDSPSHNVEPADARKLVEQAVAYAHNLGLAPHPDYVKAARIFGSIDPRESTELFEFGKNGKPYFIAGPHDSPARCRQILATLNTSVGPGGFDYLIPIQGSALADIPGNRFLASGIESLEPMDEMEPVDDPANELPGR